MTTSKKSIRATPRILRIGDKTCVSMHYILKDAGHHKSTVHGKTQREILAIAGIPAAVEVPYGRGSTCYIDQAQEPEFATFLKGYSEKHSSAAKRARREAEAATAAAAVAATATSVCTVKPGGEADVSSWDRLRTIVGVEIQASNDELRAVIERQGAAIAELNKKLDALCQAWGVHAAADKPLLRAVG